jgi:hypothetical protein
MQPAFPGGGERLDQLGDDPVQMVARDAGYWRS